MNYDSEKGSKYMSNEYITYGPGKDVDPMKLQERLDKGFMHNPEQTLWTALQQREERKDKANETIMLHHIAAMKTKGNPYSDGVRRGLRKAFAALNNLTNEEVELILEGNRK